ncbi:MAG: hypothetical protein AAF708_09560 [Deinococcota bacterium]
MDTTSQVTAFIWNYQEHAGDGDIDLPNLGGILTLPQMYRNVF